MPILKAHFKNLCGNWDLFDILAKVAPGTRLIPSFPSISFLCATGFTDTDSRRTPAPRIAGNCFVSSLGTKKRHQWSKGPDDDF